jgi:hypothetical protein
MPLKALTGPIESGPPIAGELTTRCEPRGFIRDDASPLYRPLRGMGFSHKALSHAITGIGIS